jgi:hypothetical protein
MIPIVIGLILVLALLLSVGLIKSNSTQSEKLNSIYKDDCSQLEGCLKAGNCVDWDIMVESPEFQIFKDAMVNRCIMNKCYYELQGSFPFISSVSESDFRKCVESNGGYYNPSNLPDYFKFD